MTLIKSPERQRRLREKELREKPIEGVAWDLDDTVWWQKAPWIRDLQAVLEEYGVKLSGRQLKNYDGGRIVDKIVKDYKIPVDPKEVSGRVNERHIETMKDGMTLTPGAMQALRRFQRLGLLMGAATSGWEYIVIPRLYDTGIAEFIPTDRVVTREHVQHTKPHPEPILTAAKRMGLDPKNIVYVGNEETDVIAAQEAGARAILVTHGVHAQKHKWGADLVVPYLFHLNANALNVIGTIQG